MSDHNGQQLSPREMVRAHAYPALAAISTLSLVAIAVLQVPGAIKAHRYNLCVDQQASLRQSRSQAVKHCEGL